MEVPKLPKEHYEAFKQFRATHEIKVPSMGRPPGTPEEQKRERAYALRQLRKVKAVTGPELPEWLFNHLGAIAAAWEALAGPPEPPPFRFSAYLKQHDLEGPDRTLHESTAERARERSTQIRNALAQDPPPEVRYQRTLKAWAGVYLDRARRLEMDFGAAETRKGPPAKEIARKAAKRQADSEHRQKHRGKG